MNPGICRHYPSHKSNKTKKKLLEFCKYFIREVLDGLGKCPAHFYDFVSALYDYLGNENEAAVFQFIFINFFACALENPDEYALSLKKPTKHVRKTLSIIAEMITNLAKGTEKIIKDISLDPSDRNEYMTKLQTWAKNDKQSFIAIDHTIEWSKERYHIMNLTDFIIENEDTIEHNLKQIELEYIQTLSFSFGENELLESLDPPPIEDVNSKERRRLLIDSGLTQSIPVHRLGSEAPHATLVKTKSTSRKKDFSTKKKK
jgi:hypothetical protein